MFCLNLYRYAETVLFILINILITSCIRKSKWSRLKLLLIFILSRDKVSINELIYTLRLLIKLGVRLWLRLLIKLGVRLWLLTFDRVRSLTLLDSDSTFLTRTSILSLQFSDSDSTTQTMTPLLRLRLHYSDSDSTTHTKTPLLTFRLNNSDSGSTTPTPTLTLTPLFKLDSAQIS